MADRAKHAFGALENIDIALSNGTIDAFDILFVKDANGKPYVGWIDKQGQKVIVNEEDEVVFIKEGALPASGEEGKVYVFGENAYVWNGTEFKNLCKPTDLTELEETLATKASKEEVEQKLDAAVLDVIDITNANTAAQIETRIQEVMTGFEVIEF